MDKRIFSADELGQAAYELYDSDDWNWFGSWRAGKLKGALKLIIENPEAYCENGVFELPEKYRTIKEWLGLYAYHIGYRTGRKFQENTMDKIIARSKARFSNTDGIDEFYFEYRLHSLDHDERENVAGNYGLREVWSMENPIAMQRRRVDVVAGVHVPREWDLFRVEDGEQRAAVFGDGGYWDAESLDPIHTITVMRLKRKTEVQRELNELRDKITPNKFTRKTPLQDHYDSVYKSELKAAHLWSKAQRDEAPFEKLQPIHNKVMAAWNDEMDRIDELIRKLEDELAILNRKLGYEEAE